MDGQELISGLLALLLLSAAGWLIGRVLRRSPVRAGENVTGTIRVFELCGDRGRIATRRLAKRLARVADKLPGPQRWVVVRIRNEANQTELDLIRRQPFGDLWISGHVAGDGRLDLGFFSGVSDIGIGQIWRSGLLTCRELDLRTGSGLERHLEAHLAGRSRPFRAAPQAVDTEAGRDLIGRSDGNPEGATALGVCSGHTRWEGAYLLAWGRMVDGLAHACEGRLEESAKEFRELLALAPGSRDPRELAQIEAQIGAICLAISVAPRGYARLLEGLEACERALDRLSQTTECETGAIVHVLEARHLIRLAEWDGESEILGRASVALDAAREVFTNHGNVACLGDVALTLGELEGVRAELTHSSRNLELALGHFREAGERAKAANNAGGLDRARKAIANVLVRLGEGRDDEVLLGEAEAICLTAIAEGRITERADRLDNGEYELMLARLLTIRAYRSASPALACSAVDAAERGLAALRVGRLSLHREMTAALGLEIAGAAHVATATLGAECAHFEIAAELFERSLDRLGPGAPLGRRFPLALARAGALLSLARATPETEVARLARDAFEFAEARLSDDMPGVTRAEVIAGAARASALAGGHANGAGMVEFRYASKAYRRALSLVERSRTPGLWARLQSELGQTLTALGRAGRRVDLLDEASEAFRRALGEFRGRTCRSERLRALGGLAEAAANSAELGGSRERLREARDASLEAFDDLAASETGGGDIERARRSLHRLERAWRRQQI